MTRAIAGVIMASLSVSTVFAQPAAECASGDECELFAEGRRLMGAGKPAEACDKFAAAYAKDPTAVGTVLSLGACSEMLGKVGTALDWFRRGKALAVDAKLPDSEGEADRRIASLSTRVPKLELIVEGAATLTLDGKAVAPGVYEVDPGEHAVQTIGGAHDEKRIVHAQLGQRLRVVLATEAPRSMAPAYIVGSVGLALIAGSVVLSSYGKDQYDSAATFDDQAHWKSVVRYGGTGMFAGGVLAVGAAVWLGVRASHHESSDSYVAPVAGNGAVGLAVGGGF